MYVGIAVSVVAVVLVVAAARVDALVAVVVFLIVHLFPVLSALPFLPFSFLLHQCSFRFHRLCFPFALLFAVAYLQFVSLSHGPW